MASSSSRGPIHSSSNTAEGPGAGSRLRVALARNQVIDQRQTRWTTTWSWHVAGQAGLHAPESYPVVELTR